MEIVSRNIKNKGVTERIGMTLLLLVLSRLGTFIPIPGVDHDAFYQSISTNPIVSFLNVFSGGGFASIGIFALGIVPYVNASIVMQLATTSIPSLERLQKEEGELGRQQISKYTRYLTFFWAVILSTGIAFFLIKPVVFNWSLLLGFKIIIALTTGSMLSMWFAELITNENLGNGSSMLIFINIIGGIPANFTDFSKNLNNEQAGNSFSGILISFFVYLLIVAIIVLVQDSYKKVNIVSARQLNFNYLEQNSQSTELKNSYIPIKLNQGGIMPLVFSSTIATLLFYPLQLAITSFFSMGGNALTSILTFCSFGLNLVLVIFFSSFYALLVLKPKDLSENLTKMAYSIPGLKQGKETTQYLEQTISRLAFMGGIFLAFLAFFPFLLGNVFQFNIFKNLTSLIILIGVITDVSSQIRGYLVSQNYESFKKA